MPIAVATFYRWPPGSGNGFKVTGAYPRAPRNVSINHRITRDRDQTIDGRSRCKRASLIFTRAFQVPRPRSRHHATPARFLAQMRILSRSIYLFPAPFSHPYQSPAMVARLTRFPQPVATFPRRNSRSERGASLSQIFRPSSSSFATIILLFTNAPQPSFVLPVYQPPLGRILSLLVRRASERIRGTFSIHRSCVLASSVSVHQDAAVPRSSRTDQPARCSTALVRACLSVSRRFRPRFARYFHQRGTRGRAILLVAGIIHNSPVSPLLRLSARSRTYVSLLLAARVHPRRDHATCPPSSLHKNSAGWRAGPVTFLLAVPVVFPRGVRPPAVPGAGARSSGSSGSSGSTLDSSPLRGRRKLARNLSTGEPLLRLRAPRHKRK